MFTSCFDAGNETEETESILSTKKTTGSNTEEFTTDTNSASESENQIESTAETGIAEETEPAAETTDAETEEELTYNSSPTYIDGILVVNKTYPLPPDYNPGTDQTAQTALYEMFNAAEKDGISLWVASGFRSYDTQAWLYGNYVAQAGKEAADTFSARAGHSEHQSGLAFDLNYVEDWFADSPAGIWIAENSWKYGFIIRYPKGKEDMTGYKYEPWHVRYFGKDVAEKLYKSGLCLEEYLGITSEYNY